MNKKYQYSDLINEEGKIIVQYLFNYARCTSNIILKKYTIELDNDKVKNYIYGEINNIILKYKIHKSYHNSIHFVMLKYIEIKTDDFGRFFELVQKEKIKFDHQDFIFNETLKKILEEEIEFLETEYR